MADEPCFCIAGLWRLYADGEAYTMLTIAPGPEVAIIQGRQNVVLGRETWKK